MVFCWSHKDRGSNSDPELASSVAGGLTKRGNSHREQFGVKYCAEGYVHEQTRGVRG